MRIFFSGISILGHCLSFDEEGYNPFPKTLLRRLANCPQLTEVDLPDKQLRDYHLKKLGRAHSIQRLSLSNNPIRGNGLKYLAGLRNLRGLDLSATQLQHLKDSSYLGAEIPVDDAEKNSPDVQGGRYHILVPSHHSTFRLSCHFRLSPLG